MIIRDHKTSGKKGPKVVPLLKEDVEFIATLPKGFPNMNFFRRDTKGGGHKAGEKFGPRLMYGYWIDACKILGIEGVDLYGGTKHSTACELGDYFTPEEIKDAMMISTNKAFERYFRVKPQAIRAVYEKARIGGDTGVTPLRAKSKGSKRRGT